MIEVLCSELVVHLVLTPVAACWDLFTKSRLSLPLRCFAVLLAGTCVTLDLGLIGALPLKAPGLALALNLLVVVWAVGHFLLTPSLDAPLLPTAAAAIKGGQDLLGSAPEVAHGR